MISYVKFGSFLCFLLSSFFLLTYFNAAEGTGKSVITPTVGEQPDAHFINLVSTEDESILNTSLSYIDRNWKASYEPMLLETFYFSQNRKISDRLRHLLERKTQQDFGYDFDEWFHWLWNKDPEYTDVYFAFKANLHQLLDPKFRNYFLDRAQQSTIRLDEVRWGGVPQDGIPPLRSPEMITANEASYLRDSNIVFGISVNGDARAYPKRILAWHEMFVDEVGNVPVAGVYCTLCGTVILYKTVHNGVNHQLGTSGFLYRSNKLMYDKATQTLWSTLEGEPAIGPLVGKGIKLDYLSVVTTTWGEWKKRHPKTTVLSLNTGHRRDYGEGVAYQEYFATDELMFTVPREDRRLKNKDEILSVRLPGLTNENLAISHKFLKKNPIYHSKIDVINFAVFTDRSGAHRAYDVKEKIFEHYDGTSKVTDSSGVSWVLSEEGMVSDTGEELQRIPTHNAFWFGYHAAFPDAKLIR